jgi:predicted 2-oxoglutarate/Fe(II)-dependent dioxygenase YbiX
MESIATEIAALLSAVNRPGDFFVAGTTEMLASRLEVDGVGPVALPLLPIQARQLVAAAERAPYGRGEDTVVDTDVRRTWQIGPDRMRIEGKHWGQTLDAVLARVAEGLGIGEPITAQVYKLLVYDQGSFFVSHRDTEKVAGMFATLVLVLPSVAAGGELVVRHKDREVRLDLRCEEPSELAFAAFYADCVHEVLPVTDGCRLALVYNVLRKGKGPVPQPPSYELEQTKTGVLLQAWVAGQPAPDDGLPEKLVYPLEHAYSPAELSFDTLKGADAAVAAVLVAAAPQAGCELHLAQVSIEESGAAEYKAGFDWRRRRSAKPEDAFEAGEVFDRHVTLSEWRRPDGGRPALGELPIEDDEISPPDAFEDMEPDEVEFHEATGNEGVSYDRSYHRAVLVLWPRDRTFAVLNQGGLPVTVPYLDDLIARWIAGGSDRQSRLWHQAHELAGHMLSTWPTERGYRGREKSPSVAARMLTSLTKLHDTERLEAFLSNVIARGLFDQDDNEAILAALGDLPPDRAAALIERIVAEAAATFLGPCANLLARAAAAPPHGRPTDLRGAATALIEALPGDPGRVAPRPLWQRDSGVQTGVVVDLFAAAVAVDSTLAERAADHVLAWPKTYDFDTVLIPAVRTLKTIVPGSTAIQRLGQACIVHLRARVAEPLEEPRDWQRTSAVGCKCRHCTELSGFLDDPLRKSWIFKAVQADRSHVETTIVNAHCDLDVRTERRGSPHSLICTKNQASHDRRVRQRNNDLEDLKQLGA